MSTTFTGKDAEERPRLGENCKRFRFSGGGEKVSGVKDDPIKRGESSKHTRKEKYS